MLKQSIIIFSLISFCIISGFAQASRVKPFNSDTLIGNWIGSWDGDTSGKFKMKIIKDSRGKFSGTIDTSPDDGEPYHIYFEPTVAKGNKVTAKFEDPYDELEVSIEAIVEGSTLKGKYVIREKAKRRKVEDGKLKATKMK